MVCPIAVPVEAHVDLDTRADGKEVLAHLIDIEAKRKCMAGGTGCRALRYTVIEYEESVVFRDDKPMFHFYTKMLVDCGVPRRKPWDIIIDAIGKGLAIAAGIWLLIYGGVYIFGALLSNPQKAGEVIKFGKIMAEKLKKAA